MLNKNFIDFSIKLLLKDKKEYLFVLFIFTFIVFILSSVLFISDSIKEDLLFSLKNTHQMIVKNTKAGRYIPLSEKHIDGILQINGVEDVRGKVDGYYYFSQAKKYFHIVSDDSLDDETLIISKQIQMLLKQFHYEKSMNFLTLRGVVMLPISKEISSNVISNDVMLVNTANARKILEMDDEEYSYLDVLIPNDSEIDFIGLKIADMFPHAKIISKATLLADYKHIFYYKGGIFMIIYIVAMISFFILLKHQISSVFGEKKKEIAILRSIGFAIKDIIFLKFIQNSVVAISSFILGIFIAYFYVFLFNAPLLRNIFLGSDVSYISFTPMLDFKIVFMLFIFSVIPFLASVLLPSWRIAIEDMSEVMK